MNTLNILRDDRGVTITFVAVFLLIFLMFIGLSIDAGWMVYVRAQGQSRVDSAALAGAAGLFDQNAVTRETAVKDLAVQFSDTENPVLTTATDRNNDVIPMDYNPATKTLTEAPSW